MFITSPDKFAAEFNQVVPGAYRKIDTADVRDMTDCSLIGRYGQYYRSDIETVRAILQYEQMRQNRQNREEIRDSDGSIHCRRCGTLLTSRHDVKRGRPREYCPNCEPFRGRERYRKWRSEKGVSLINSVREVSSVTMMFWLLYTNLHKLVLTNIPKC